MTDLSRDIPKKPTTAEHINDNRLPQVNDFYQAITDTTLKKANQGNKSTKNQTGNSTQEQNQCFIRLGRTF
jgi:hypothetical protein